jgi:hypothetical protein
MFHDEPLTLAELQAWQRHPDTVARMAEVERWVAEQRDKEWEAEQRAMRQEALEKEAAERHAEQEREQARARAERQRQREERAKHHGLLIRRVSYERRGDHDIWSTGYKTKRMVHGIASTPTITTNNHSRSSKGCKVEFPIPLLCSHENLGSIGEVVMLRRSPREIYIIAALHDGNLAADFAWSLVEQGDLRAFSVASIPGSGTVDGSVFGTKFYGSWQLAEVSLCRNGANPDCNNVQIFSPRRKFPY